MSQSHRLGQKIHLVSTHFEKNEKLPIPNLLEVLSRDEGKCNAIPGYESDETHPNIIVHSTKIGPSLPPQITYHSPRFCLERLEASLLKRLENQIPTKVIKIVLDRIHPSDSDDKVGTMERLLVIAELADRLDAKLEVDLLPSVNSAPIALEEHLKANMKRPGWTQVY